MSDPYSEFTVSLLHFDGSSGSTVFTDAASVGVWSASGSAQISTAQSKFGGASLQISGSSCITQPHSATIDVGTGAFTVEMFVRRSETSAVAALYARASSSNNVPTESSLFCSTASKISFYYGLRGINQTQYDFTVATMSANTWYHVAFCRDDSGLMKLYLNGVASANSYTDTQNLSGPHPLAIGRFLDIYNQFSGWIDEFRFTRGVARYGANFTPPSAAFDDPTAPVITYRGLLGPVGRLTCEPPAALYPAGGVYRGAVVGQRDAYYAGGGRVAGTVQQSGTPPAPLRRKVRLFDERAGWLVRETWSNPVTGTYSFGGVDLERAYTVITYDHLLNYRAVIADNLTLANGGVELVP